MRVLHLAAGNLFGGIETYLLTLARLRHLCPEMEPHFGLCFPGRLRDEIIAAGVPVHDLGGVRLSRPWTLWRGRRRLKQLLRHFEFETVATHGCWPHAVFAPVVRQAGARLVNFVHSELTGKHVIDRRAARTPPDLVIANSIFTAATAKTVFPGVSTIVSYPPVPQPVPFDRAAARADYRTEFGTSADAIVILMVSRIEKLKGHSVFFDALGRLRESAGWISWVVGGAQRPHEVELLADLRRMVDRLGIADRVRFVGERADVVRLMAAADIYCQPNTGPEGFGITLIEALHAGLPVVTSRIGGAIEIVSGVGGELCPHGDSAAVATALGELIADRARCTRGEAGRRRAAEMCDPARYLSALASSLGQEVRL